MRTIVIGDVHGCLEELDELLKQVSFVKGSDRLVFAGDLVDRGPDSLGVLRRVIELNAESVMGNHEEKHIRFRRHELKKSMQPGYKNPMKPFYEKRMQEHRSFGEAEWAYMERMPLWIRLAPNWVLVHAGVRVGLSMEEQHENELLRLRHIRRDNGAMAHIDDAKTPLTHAFWTELWRGPDSIVYGHNVWKTGIDVETHWVGGDIESAVVEPKCVQCIGIDTGCCFGMQLTALIFNDGVVGPTAHVKAKQVYHKYTERD